MDCSPPQSIDRVPRAPRRPRATSRPRQSEMPSRKAVLGDSGRRLAHPWRSRLIEEIEFAVDSPLEGNGFELPVRGAMNLVFAPLGYWLRPSEIAPIIFVRHSLSDARIPTTKPRFVVGARAVIRSFVTVIDRRTVSGACYPPKRPLGIAQIPGRRPT
jgi:hypothetical protein